MTFKAVYLDYSRFVVNKSEKNDKIALNKSTQQYWHFSYFSMKIYVVGTHQKHLTEALLKSPQHNVFMKK